MKYLSRYFAGKAEDDDARLPASQLLNGAPMYIVAIASQKGGAGKTTLALNLAVAAEQNGHVAAVIDLDPQASATGWKTSARKTPAVVRRFPPPAFEQAIAICRESGADIVFFDTAPHSSNDALTAAEAADLILIPCRPAFSTFGQ